MNNENSLDEIEPIDLYQGVIGEDQFSFSSLFFAVFPGLHSVGFLQ